MKIGVNIFPTEYSIGVVEFGQRAEDLAFESVFFPEHTHIPVDRRSPYPVGGDLPRAYAHTLDPLAALAAVAAVTTRILLGTSVCLVTQHDPIVLAKQVATVDLISHGRLLFGVGAGWNEEEMRNHGTNPPDRWRVMGERIQAMQRIWAQDEADYHGRFVDFDPIWSWPKPVQRPHPPILVGGDGPHTFQRVVAYGDAWFPLAHRSPTPLADKIANLQRLAATANRGPIPVTVLGVRPDPGVLARFERMGVDRCVISLPSAGRDEVVPLLARYAGLAREFHAGRTTAD